MKEPLKKIPLRVEKVDTLEFSVGVVLVLVSLLMPLAFNMHNFPVRRYLFEALRWSEKTFLMTAALKWSFCLMIFPHLSMICPLLGT